MCGSKHMTRWRRQNRLSDEKPLTLFDFVQTYRKTWFNDETDRILHHSHMPTKRNVSISLIRDFRLHMSVQQSFYLIGKSAWTKSQRDAAVFVLVIHDLHETQNGLLTVTCFSLMASDRLWLWSDTVCRLLFSHFCVIGNTIAMGYFGAFWSQYPLAIDVLTVNVRI